MNPGFELLQEIHRFFDTYLKGWTQAWPPNRASTTTR